MRQLAFGLLVLLVAPGGLRAYSHLPREIAREVGLGPLGEDRAQVLFRRLLERSCGVTVPLGETVLMLDLPDSLDLVSVRPGRTTGEVTGQYLDHAVPERTFFVAVRGRAPDSLVLAFRDGATVTLRSEEPGRASFRTRSG